MLTDICQDATSFEYRYDSSNLLILSVHNSNKAAKFIDQWNSINTLLDNHTDKIVVVCGDFNATPLKRDENTLEFSDKDSLDKVIYSHRYYRNFTVSNFRSTTGKVRCLTSQIPKMLSPAFATIDGFILFSPAGKECINFTNMAVYMDRTNQYDSTNEVIYPPNEWPSDHALIMCFIPDKGAICSMNVFGESIEQTIPLNIFEIFTKRCWDKFQNDPHISNEFQRLKMEFIESRYPDGRLMKDLIKSKYLSTITREYAITGSVFHPPRRIQSRTFFYEILKEAYEKAVNDFEKSLLTKSNAAEIRLAVETILRFYKSCMESPFLEEFFDQWYLELESSDKIDIHDIVKYVLTNTKPLVFCLQEVSKGMMQSFIERLEYYNSLGYDFDVLENFELEGKNNKTRGLLIYQIL